MGLWDLSFKVLSRARPHDLLGLVPGIDPSRSLRLIDKELEPRALSPCCLRLPRGKNRRAAGSSAVRKDKSCSRSSTSSRWS